MQKPGLFGMNGLMFLLLTCITVTVRAQQPGNLILLESENKKAFTVRMGDNFFPSSGQGHLVLSRLKDSIYRLGIRSNNNMAERVFPVTVRHKDLGFQLKGNETDWVLYNWQTKETIQPLKEKDSSRILNQGVKKENGFSRLMAAVVNDSSVLYNTYTGSFAKDSSKAQSIKPKAESDIIHDSVSSSGVPSTANRQPSTASHQPPTANGQPPTTNAQPPATKGQPPAAVVVAATGPSDKKARKDSLQAAKKTQESLALLVKNAKKDSLAAVKKTRDSLQTAQKMARKDSLLAVKKSRDSLAAAQKQVAKDTALVKTSRPPAVLPPTANGKPPTVPPPTANRQPSTPVKANIKKWREVTLKVSRKLVFLDLGPGGVTDTITLFIYFETGDLSPAKQPLVANAAEAKKTSKTDSTEILNQAAARNKLAQRASEAGCGQLASDADMLFLRSAILRANSEQAKVSLASSAFGQKCFAVDQVRILAGLIVSDKGRYQIMEAARLHIADPEHFHELANMFTDKNFKRKFLAMAGKRT
jgi:hypothetical protein